jgi:hypothetical protein
MKTMTTEKKKKEDVPLEEDLDERCVGGRCSFPRLQLLPSCRKLRAACATSGGRSGGRRGEGHRA